MKLYEKLRFHRLTALFLAVLMLFALPSCNQRDGDVTTPVETTAADPAPTPYLPPVVEMLPAQEVKVLDQNVENASTDTIIKRAPEMIQYFLASGADSIGVQECVQAWTDRLDEGLKSKYARVGVECMTGADKGWFSTYVYYRKDKYRVIATDTFWLSTTPDVPSQYSDTVDLPRTCTWVILEDKVTGFRYVHMNCHLDWMDEVVNAIQVQMIRAQMIRFAEMGYPVFATGDLNTSEGSIAYDQMLESEWISNSKHIAKKTDATPSHLGNNETIDYCFVTGGNMTVEEYAVIDHIHNGTEVSDHNGIMVRATVASIPKPDHGKAVAQFFADAELTVNQNGDVTVTLPQARDANGRVAKQYDFVLKDENGDFVFETSVFGCYNRPLQPLTVSVLLTDGVAGKTYQLEITPISIFGTKGNTIVRAVVW